ncbi:MAG: hypothetical protein KAF41_04665, partial [Flavobacterium sp.]|nr:hypothetical protein [Flavobacterium sp.]
MPKYLSYSFFMLMLFPPAAYSQLTNSQVKAKIHLGEIEGNIKITGTAENLTDIVQSLSYKLSVIRKNKINSNQSKNAQEGLFT